MKVLRKETDDEKEVRGLDYLFPRLILLALKERVADTSFSRQWAKCLCSQSDHGCCSVYKLNNMTVACEGHDEGTRVYLVGYFRPSRD